ncbi:MAG TPA: hypothetical protein VGY55_07965 [Pirellulales bacterium]|jgi:hypothetical protein|nr:hypothetical protein [Pirellulales bacterium]
MPHLLQIKLAATRRRVRRLLLVYGLSRMATVVLPALLLLGGIDFWLRFEDRGVRAIWSLAAFGIAVWGFVRFMLPALQRRLDEVAVAQRIESNLSGYGDQLSSAIEFLGERSDDPLAGSAVLRRAAVAQAEARIGQLDWSAAVDRRPVFRAAALAGAIALLAAATCALRPADSLLAAVRLVNPLGSTAWPPFNDLTFTHRVERLAVDQPFEVELVDLNRHLPDDVRIEYRTTSQSGAEQVEREKMQPVGDMMVARKEKVVQSFEYRAEGGDDHKMAWIHVDVVEPPRIKSLEITLHPPAYTGRPVQSAERRIVALRGTAVEMHAIATKPLVSAVLRQKNGPDVAAQVTDDGRGFVLRPDLPGQTAGSSPPTDSSDKDPGGARGKSRATSLVIDKSGPYWFELRDREGLVAGPEDRWEIQAITDQPPSMDFQQPNENLLVTAGAVVPIKIVAKDDLSIHTIDLVYTRSDHTEIGETAIRLFTGPDRATAFAAPAAGRSLEGETDSIDYPWELGPLKLAPGAHVLLTATASDYLPQTGASLPRRLTIITPAELEDHLSQREMLIFNELSRILKMQQAARMEIGTLESTFDHVGRFQKSDVDRLRRNELDQRQIRRSLVSPTEGARAQIVALLGELASNRVANPELQGRMQRFADEIARLDRNELAAIERELTAAVKGADDLKALPSHALRESLADVGRTQSDVSATLEEMLGHLAEWNSVRGIARALADIRRDQTILESDTKELAARTLTKDPQDLSPAEQSDLRRIAGRQLDLGRQFEKIEQRMGQVAEQLKSTDPASADSIADAARAGRDAGIGGLMREAGEIIEQNQIGQALGRQSSAGRGLDEMLDVLSNRRERELSRLVKKLRDAEHTLSELKTQQEGLRNQIQEAGGNQDQTERRKELERLSRREREFQDEADRQSRQLQRLQADKASNSLARAAGQMGSVRKAAASGDHAAADDHAATVKEDLDDAQQQLADARRKAESDLADEQLARLDDNLKGLVDRQRHANDETARLEKLRADQGQSTRAQSQTLHDLSRDQRGLADETAQLGEKLAGAEAFQFVLDAASQEMTSVADRLQDRDTGSATQQLEQDALSRLKQLVEAMKEDKPAGGDPQAGTSGQGGSGDPANSQQGNTIRTMAELRLIRQMQEDVNRRTQRLTEAVGDRHATDDQRAEFSRLAKEQGRLADLMLGLSGGKQ